MSRQFKSKVIQDPFAPNVPINPQQQQGMGRQQVTGHYPNNMQQRIFSKTGEHDHVRFAIATLYQGFKVVKVAQYQQWGVYKAPVSSMMANIEKFIVAVVQNDSQPLGNIVPLEGLRWTSFQCRSCTDINKEMNGYYIAQQGYSLPRERSTVLYDNVSKVVEYDDKCIFLPENLPLKIEVIKAKPDEFIADKGNVIACLEIYQTILTLQDVE